MAIIEVDIKDENKVEFIKQLLKEYGLLEVAINVFSDKDTDIKLGKKISKKDKID